ncbi:hypothetical protein L596_014472 [Steinernema carpocapsae]|uniref:Uncharacterized protein n=1 Tax=Steinernema carpocapsae TaxID=34508 RepID=A0A4U5NCT9_STECR|nr:hypothetical protein L596_014472 [Steinernema carpocapsae]
MLRPLNVFERLVTYGVFGMAAENTFTGVWELVENGYTGTAHSSSSSKIGANSSSSCYGLQLYNCYCYRYCLLQIIQS